MRPLPKKLPYMSADKWRWRWMVTRRWNRLHRIVYAGRVGWKADPTYPERVGARTACGLVGDFCMPGIFSRMGLSRCAHCCRRLGIPRGNGAPYNGGMKDA